MCKAVEELAKGWADESRIDTLYKNIRSIIKNMKCTVDQAMKILEISDEDRVVLLKRF